jgi:hypothetical protein
MLRRQVLAASWPLLAACASPRPRDTKRIDTRATFDRLKTLTGLWEETAFATPRERVEYTLTANNTVLVERWSLRSGHESVTHYLLDGPDLIAHHYCPLHSYKSWPLCR